MCIRDSINALPFLFFTLILLIPLLTLALNEQGRGDCPFLHITTTVSPSVGRCPTRSSSVSGQASRCEWSPVTTSTQRAQSPPSVASSGEETTASYSTARNSIDEYATLPTHRSTNLSLYMSLPSLSVYLSVCLSVCPSICLSIHLSIHLSVCLSVCLSIYLSISLSIHLSICLSICPSICMSVCLSVCLSIYLSLRFISLSLRPVTPRGGQGWSSSRGSGGSGTHHAEKSRF